VAQVVRLDIFLQLDERHLISERGPKLTALQYGRPEGLLLSAPSRRSDGAHRAGEDRQTYDLGHQKVAALRGMDVRIERNEFVAIVGSRARASRR